MLLEYAADAKLYVPLARIDLVQRFRGAGERAFCAGGDLRALYESYRRGDSLHDRLDGLSHRRAPRPPCG